MVYTAGALHYNQNVNLVSKLHKKINVPIILGNDANSAALSEVWKGNLKDFDDGIVLILGTGIGCGIVHKKVIKEKNFSLVR